VLVFIDESGHPHPNDSARRPVVTAVCISDRDSRTISGRIHALKRDNLGHERTELKGRNLINRSTFRRKPDFNQFLEEFFSAVLNLPVTIFAVIMQSPFLMPASQIDRLPNRFRYLVQRIELLAEQKDEMATIMFDGQPNLYGGIGWQFNGFLYRSDEGRACTHITDAPSFVDSKTSTGIQIADLAASVIRIYHEADLHRSAPSPGDQFLFAIRRWYRIIEEKTQDNLVSHEGYSRPGFFRMATGEV
jgi:hypothetical protein